MAGRSTGKVWPATVVSNNAQLTPRAVGGKTEVFVIVVFKELLLSIEIEVVQFKHKSKIGRYTSEILLIFKHSNRSLVK